MKRTIYLLALLLITSIAYGQKTDMNGNWKLNKEKSQLGEQFSMAPLKIEIKQEKNLLTETRQSNFQGEDFTNTNKYTLDGLESKNPGWMDSVVKSTAKWSDDKTTLKIVSKFPLQDGGEMTVNYDYTLKEGRLVITTNANSSWGEFGETQVYDKE